MHWVYAVAEALRKTGGATDTMIVLDPNFPAWSQMDRTIEWDGPQMQKAMGIPFFFLVKFILNMALKGPMLKLAKWDTAAERELTVHDAVSSYACFTFTHTPHTHALEKECREHMAHDGWRNTKYETRACICRSADARAMMMYFVLASVPAFDLYMHACTCFVLAYIRSHMNAGAEGHRQSLSRRL